ncbi:MAG: biopolymer transporter ExbD [Candidatus Cloacimonetes bacterium]|nr:biopolymer transporter ExbD [Candidatus Cloacimonadota bacterium]
MKVSTKHKAITSVALISMSDVVFLLLIFLLISSNFVTYTGLQIDIPTSQNAHTDIQRNLTLSINEREEIFINSIPVRRENLIAELRSEIEKNPEIVVLIQADQNIALKNVVEIIDAAKSAGSTRFFLAAQLIRR